MAKASSALDQLTWKDVLGSRAPKAPWYGHIDSFFELAVLPSGYLWFEWKGRVYEVHGFQERTYVDTGLTTGMLDERQVRRASTGQRLGRWWRDARQLRLRHVLTVILALGAWAYMCAAIIFIGHVTIGQYALIVGPPIIMATLADVIMVRK